MDGPAFQDTTPGAASQSSASEDDQLPYGLDESSESSPRSSQSSTSTVCSWDEASISSCEDTQESIARPVDHSNDEDTE